MKLFSSSTYRQATFLIPGVCLAALLGQSASAQTFNVTSGDWNTAGSWSPAVVPGTGVSSNAVFSSVSGQTATLNAATQVGRLNVSGTTHTIQGLTSVRTLAVLGTGANGSSVGSGSGLNLDRVNLLKGASSTMTLSAGIAFSNGASFDLSGGTLRVNNAASAFSGTGNFNINSGGTLRLDASSTLSLGSSVTTTFASGSALNIAGTSSVLSNSGSLVFSGSPTISTATAFTLNTSGSLSVGTTDVDLITGGNASPVNFNSGSTFSLSITDASTGGSLTTGGAITLSGSPTLSVTSVAVPNSTVFTILDGSASGSGTFSGLPDNTIFVAGGGSQQYRINYSGGDVTLTAVPEPQEYAAAVGLGLVAFTAWRRSRKTA